VKHLWVLSWVMFSFVLAACVAHPIYTPHPTRIPYPTYTPHPTHTLYPTYTPYPPHDRQIIATDIVENAGMVCFEEFEKSSGLRGYFIPRGYDCYYDCGLQSSQASLFVTVDTHRSTIRLYTSFAMQQFTPKPRICLDVCAEVVIDFAIRDGEHGTYSLWLGDEKLGEITIPTERICFEAR